MIGIHLYVFFKDGGKVKWRSVVLVRIRDLISLALVYHSRQKAAGLVFFLVM